MVYPYIYEMKVLKTLIFILVLTRCSGYTMDLPLTRRDVAASEPYYTTNDPNVLGAPNDRAALGNPMKGLIGGARWATTPLPNNVPLSVEW